MTEFVILNLVSEVLMLSDAVSIFLRTLKPQFCYPSTEPFHSNHNPGRQDALSCSNRLEFPGEVMTRGMTCRAYHAIASWPLG